MADNDFYNDIDMLKSNLFLLATEFENLKFYLTSYSEEGMYNECLEGIRGSMERFSFMIYSEKLPLPTIAKIFDCYYQMESLARYPSSSNNLDAFKTSKDWQMLRQSAKAAAEALEDIS